MKFLNKTMIMMAVASLIATGTAFSQTGKLGVKKGEKITYEMTTQSDVVQTVQEQDMKVNSTGSATMELGVKNIAKDHIDWNYTMAKMQLKISAGIPGMGKDTTMKGNPLPFTTDLAGRVTSSFSAEDDATGKMMMGMQKHSMAEFFSPTLVRDLKAGDSWEETTTDTIVNPQLQGAKIYVKRTTRRTFDGTVDTLKARALRLRTEVTSMSVSGDGNVHGMKLTIQGDGFSSATSYYNAGDGLLMSSGSQGEMNLRVMTSGQMEMVIPIAYKYSTSTVRKS